VFPSQINYSKASIVKNLGELTLSYKKILYTKPGHKPNDGLELPAETPIIEKINNNK